MDRFLAPPDMVDSRMYHRHMQLVELIWTAEDRGREYYEIIRPKGVSYSRFVKEVTALVCRGLEEGWLELRLPASPVPSDAAYGMIVHDTDRFVDEMAGLFSADRRAHPPLAESAP